MAITLNDVPPPRRCYGCGIRIADLLFYCCKCGDALDDQD